MPKKDQNIALLTSILRKKKKKEESSVLYHLNKCFKYSRAVSGLYIDKTIISEFGLSVYKHLIITDSHYLTPTVIPGDEMHFCTHFLFI